MVSGGTVLGGRYKLDERIASGGMGDVWRGTDEVLGRTVAIKILLPSLLDEPGFAERFRGEARTMATINHPGVVDVYDYGSDPAAGAYLVMEYVEGDALSRTLSKVGRLTPGRTMALMAQTADALQAAHEKGIVHRDVKPGNLLVRPNGTLVLTDFGIARSAAGGVRAGGPAYRGGAHLGDRHRHRAGGRAGVGTTGIGAVLARAGRHRAGATHAAGRYPDHAGVNTGQSRRVPPRLGVGTPASADPTGNRLPARRARVARSRRWPRPDDHRGRPRPRPGAARRGLRRLGAAAPQRQ